MKLFRRSVWALLGAILFLCLNLLLPNSTLLSSGQGKRAIATQPPTPETVVEAEIHHQDEDISPLTSPSPASDVSPPASPVSQTPALSEPQDAAPPTANPESAPQDNENEAVLEDNENEAILEDNETGLRDDEAVLEDDETLPEETLLEPGVLPENATSVQILAEADKLYLLGEQNQAEALYRQVKKPFPERRFQGKFELIDDPAQLNPTAQRYWQKAQKQLNRKRFNQAIVPLQRMTIRAPHFIPAYKPLAIALIKEERPEDAASVMEKLVSLAPDSAALTWDYIEVLEKAGMRLEASIAARQFAVIHPDHEEATRFHESADKNFRRFRRALKEEMILEGIIGLGLGYVLTGNPWTTGFRAAGLARLMLQGESGLGTQVANAYRKRLPMVDDPVVLEYVDSIGQDLAELMAKDRFEYEFYVVRDDDINAFALPGGKIFVNSGAILKANSEAELAGLLGHEIGHAVLSHGFQRITKGGFLSTLTGALPFGNFLSALVTSSYSRSQERQCDILGTRVLATAGYAADGLRNFMVTLKENQKRSPPPYLSSHPVPAERVSYLERLIHDNGYNRYAFEGVEKLATIQGHLQTPEEPSLEDGIQNAEEPSQEEDVQEAEEPSQNTEEALQDGESTGLQ